MERFNDSEDESKENIIKWYSESDLFLFPKRHHWKQIRMNDNDCENQMAPLKPAKIIHLSRLSV